MCWKGLSLLKDEKQSNSIVAKQNGLAFETQVSFILCCVWTFQRLVQMFDADVLLYYIALYSLQVLQVGLFLVHFSEMCQDSIDLLCRLHYFQCLCTCVRRPLNLHSSILWTLNNYCTMLKVTTHEIGSGGCEIEGASEANEWKQPMFVERTCCKVHFGF